jgi:hypothetical protein
MPTNSQQIQIYQSADGQVQLDIKLEQETVWFSQAQMATLFDTSTDNINLHLKNIYSDQELAEQATTEDFSVVWQEGHRQVKRTIKHYNLDAIISVDYRDRAFYSAESGELRKQEQIPLLWRGGRRSLTGDNSPPLEGWQA